MRAHLFLGVTLAQILGHAEKISFRIIRSIAPKVRFFPDFEFVQKGSKYDSDTGMTLAEKKQRNPGENNKRTKLGLL